MISSKNLINDEVKACRVKTWLQGPVQDPMASGPVGCHLAASIRPEGRICTMAVPRLLALQGQAG